MKKRNNGEHAGYRWERPPQQPVSVEILHSNERPERVRHVRDVDAAVGLSGCDPPLRVQIQLSPATDTGCR
jgi:hypothetical protein